METANGAATDVVSSTTDGPVVENDTSPAGTATKETLTKAEKKLKYGTVLMGEPLITWRELLKGLLAPEDNASLSEEDKEAAYKEAAEIAESALFEIFGQAENPYDAAFKIYVVFSDTRQRYKIIHKHLFNALEAWIEKCGTPEKIENWLSRDFKNKIMEKILEKGMARFETFLRIFQLDDNELVEQVKKRVNDLCTSSAKQQFSDAMKLAHHYNLHEEFPIELFVIPMLLKNKQDEVFKFLKGHLSITRKLIKFLDDMVNMNNEHHKMSRLQPYVDSKIVDKVTAYKFICAPKIILNILKKLVTPDYEMDDSTAPNYSEKKLKDKLRYLMFDRGPNCIKFTPTVFDHVKTHIKRGSPVARDVIIALFDRMELNDPEKDKDQDKTTYLAEAEMWMLYYNLDPNDFFSTIRDHFNRSPDWKVRAQKMLDEFDTEVSSNENHFLVNDDEKIPIDWIDSWRGLEYMLSQIERMGHDCMIGIDSEFRSTTNNKQEIALLQVSSQTRVYLIDFEHLDKILSQSQWNEFTERLFGGQHMKIGFDMLSDIKAYSCTIPHLNTDLQSTMTRVICLKRLANDLLDLNSNLIDLAKSSSYKQRALEGKPQDPADVLQRAIKLSDLVEVVLEIQLDKTLQKSNWSMRPLRKEQIIYAATDANILIQLFLKLAELDLSPYGKDYSTMVFEIENDLAERKETPKEKKKKTKVTEEEYAALVESINSTVLAANGDDSSPKAFITDSSFMGLGKHLRRLGVDVIFSESKEHLLRMGRDSRHSHRIIISCGKHIPEYKAVFGDGRVFIVTPLMTAKEQVKRVLTEFKIKLSPANIFTRCMGCNGDQFVMVPSIVLKTLHDVSKRIGTQFVEDMFQPTPFKEMIENVNPADHGGFGCTLDEYIPDEERFIVKCTNGVVDVYNILVMPDSSDNITAVKIDQVQPEVIDSDRPFYYICGTCGKVYWDGTHGQRYKEFADAVVGDTSTSEESVAKQ